MNPWRTLVCVLLIFPLAGCLTVPERPDPEIRVERFGQEMFRSEIFTFAPVARTDSAPVAFGACSELLNELNQRAIDQARVQLEQSVKNGPRGDYLWFGGDVAGFGSGASQFTVSLTNAEGDGFRSDDGLSDLKHGIVTGTNNQETAVDEGDLVKTDGRWTYILQGTTLRILRSDHIGDVALHGTLELGNSRQGELLLERRDVSDEHDDRLVVVLHSGLPDLMLQDVAPDSRQAWRLQSMTRILVLSLVDRARPIIETETFIEGDSTAVRLIDGFAYIVVQKSEPQLGLATSVYPDEMNLARLGLNMSQFYRLPAEFQTSIIETLARQADISNLLAAENLTVADYLPRIIDVQRRFAADRAPTEESCRRMLTQREATGRSITTIHAIRLDSADLEAKDTFLAGATPLVYAAPHSLVFASLSQDSWWFWAQPDLEEATDLHWLSLSGLEVTPRASGRVNGTILDSFSIDVEGDQLRVATTTGQWGRFGGGNGQEMVSHVATFLAKDGKLELEGIVGGIAPGERIWSARFTPERAYLITFRQTDPLWVIGFGEAGPEILGELEIPGVSTYLHPLGDDLLLTIGFGPGPDGLILDWSAVQLSLFDVSDPRNPRRADVLDLPRGHSDAVQEHHAFTYWDEVGVLAVPLTRYEKYESIYAQYHGRIAGLELVDVDRETLDLSLRGRIAQRAVIPPSVGYGGEIQRSYFLGFPERDEVSVYAISPQAVTAHDLGTLAFQDGVAFTP